MLRPSIQSEKRHRNESNFLYKQGLTLVHKILEIKKLVFSTFSCSWRSWRNILDLLLSMNPSKIAPTSENIVVIPARVNVHPNALVPE